MYSNLNRIKDEKDRQFSLAQRHLKARRFLKELITNTIKKEIWVVNRQKRRFILDSRRPWSSTLSTTGMPTK